MKTTKQTIEALSSFIASCVESFDYPGLGDVYGVGRSPSGDLLVEFQPEPDGRIAVVRISFEAVKGTPDGVPCDLCDGPYGCQCHTR